MYSVCSNVMCGYSCVFVCAACAVMLYVAIAVCLGVQRVQQCNVWLQRCVCVHSVCNNVMCGCTCVLVCVVCAVTLCVAITVCLSVQ